MKLTVVYLVGDTTIEESHLAERITVQHYPDGRMQVRLWKAGAVVGTVHYRRVERAERELTGTSPLGES